MPDAERDAYAVLQVVPGADLEVIQAAYRALAKRYHPEGRQPDAARMAEINRAYDEIRTQERRAHYDWRQKLVPVGPGRPEAAASPAPAETPTTAPEAGPLAQRIQTEEGVNEVIDFGRYEGWTIAALAQEDPNYLRWLSRTSNGLRFQKAIQEAMPGDPHVGRRVGIGR
jgi:curved DNA-binding protein CbpA